MADTQVSDEVLEHVRIEPDLEVAPSLLLGCLGVLGGNYEIVDYSLCGCALDLSGVVGKLFNALLASKVDVAVFTVALSLRFIGLLQTQRAQDDLLAFLKSS